jgi:translation initiation factor 2B subunit (eIF-2B alpha/beta/delta family)
MSEEYHRLAENLREGNLVAIVGAGLSLPYTDPESERTYPGLPGARHLVSLLAKRAYISSDMLFDQACFLYKKREGRADLERFLLGELDRPGISPLPAHHLLASMPFSSFVTTNFDVLLERALRDARKDPCPIIQDTDISRMRSTHTPIVKIHGCVTRPATMTACADEFKPIPQRLPIIDAFLKTTLANKVALFLGYDLGDYDFARVITTLKDQLGQYMPKSFAVVKTATSFQMEYWSEYGVQIISEDLTDFLKGLSTETANTAGTPVHAPRDDWRKNDYFRVLERVHTMPSETQVIDAFLAHLLEELRSPGRDLTTVLVRAEQATVAVLTARDAFEALRQVTTDVLAAVRSDASTKEEAEVIVDAEITQRSHIGQGFRKKGQGVIGRGDSLLLFSQSKRVAEFLSGVPGGTLDTCQIFVSECRPRSPEPFRDAIAFIELLRSCGGRYGDIKIIPDAIVGNLISRKQVTKVIVGAHAVYRRGGKLEAFVNTSGTALILDSALKHGVPVYVAAEEAKVKDLAASDPPPVITYNQEGSIYDAIAGRLAELSIDGKVVGVNVGYDLCAAGTNVTLITEV